MSTSTRDSEGFVISRIEAQTVRLSVRETDRERQKSRLLFFSPLVHSLFVTLKGKNSWFVNALIASRIPLDSLYRSDRIIFDWMTKERIRSGIRPYWSEEDSSMRSKRSIECVAFCFALSVSVVSCPTASIVLIVRNRHKLRFIDELRVVECTSVCVSCWLSAGRIWRMANHWVVATPRIVSCLTRLSYIRGQWYRPVCSAICVLHTPNG